MDGAIERRLAELGIALPRPPRAIGNFAYGVEQVYSPDRWTLVGEAAAFADPFYSPGSDFIGVGNTFTTDLIASDLDGEDISKIPGMTPETTEQLLAFLAELTDEDSTEDARPRP